MLSGIFSASTYGEEHNPDSQATNVSVIITYQLHSRNPVTFWNTWFPALAPEQN